MTATNKENDEHRKQVFCCKS